MKPVSRNVWTIIYIFGISTNSASEVGSEDDSTSNLKTQDAELKVSSNYPCNYIINQGNIMDCTQKSSQIYCGPVGIRTPDSRISFYY